MIKKYIKKPVQIEAIQLTESNIEEVIDFLCDGQDFGMCFEDSREDVISYIKSNKNIGIETLEGVMKASFGDYIIKGVQGEFYPCKPDIFEATYEEVK